MRLIIAAAALAADAADDAKNNTKDDNGQENGDGDDDDESEPVKTRGDAILAKVVAVNIAEADTEAINATTMTIAITRALLLTMVLASLDCDLTHIFIKVITLIVQVEEDGGSRDDSSDVLSNDGIHVLLLAVREKVRAEPKRTFFVSEENTTNNTDFNLLESLLGGHTDGGIILGIPLRGKQ